VCLCVGISTDRSVEIPNHQRYFVSMSTASTDTAEAPNRKRPKLDLSPSPEPEGPARPLEVDVNQVEAQFEGQHLGSVHDNDSDTEDHCIICLQLIVDRTVLPACSHDRFCFECVTVWSDQSRKV